MGEAEFLKVELDVGVLWRESHDGYTDGVKNDEGGGQAETEFVGDSSAVDFIFTHAPQRSCQDHQVLALSNTNYYYSTNQSRLLQSIPV